MHHRHYNLTAFVSALVAAPYLCSGKLVYWPTTARDLHNWQMTGYYVGLETEAEDHRLGASSSLPQGAVETALDIANVGITRRAVQR